MVKIKIRRFLICTASTGGCQTAEQLHLYTLTPLLLISVGLQTLPHVFVLLCCWRGWWWWCCCCLRGCCSAKHQKQL